LAIHQEYTLGVTSVYSTEVGLPQSQDR
jgi:hypothetical protein